MTHDVREKRLTAKIPYVSCFGMGQMSDIKIHVQEQLNNICYNEQLY